MNSKNSPKKKSVAGDAVRAAALAAEEEATERRRIRALLKLPLLKRTNFLRVKVGRGSVL